MNTQVLKNQWPIAKGKLKQRFPELADEDLAFDGDDEALLLRIQQRTGQTREQLEFFLEIECGCVEAVHPAGLPASGAARPGGLATGRDARTASVGEPAEHDSAARPRAGRRPPQPPINRPAPSEQRSDSLAQEQERSTGMSGQSGGV